MWILTTRFSRAKKPDFSRPSWKCSIETSRFVLWFMTRRAAEPSGSNVSISRSRLHSFFVENLHPYMCHAATGRLLYLSPSTPVSFIRVIDIPALIFIIQCYRYSRNKNVHIFSFRVEASRLIMYYQWAWIINNYVLETGRNLRLLEVKTNSRPFFQINL